jgi:hypothetical protein
MNLENYSDLFGAVSLNFIFSFLVKQLFVWKRKREEIPSAWFHVRNNRIGVYVFKKKITWTVAAILYNLILCEE